MKTDGGETDNEWDRIRRRNYWKEKLRGKGLKVTHQRLQVLSVLEENGGRHMTAEDIYELVSVDNPEIGLATVYRTLRILLDMRWWTG